MNLPFYHKSVSVVQNGGLIAFDMALIENELGPKKLTAMTIFPHLSDLSG